jgi:hypothetical protein
MSFGGRDPVHPIMVSLGEYKAQRRERQIWVGGSLGRTRGGYYYRGWEGGISLLNNRKQARQLTGPLVQLSPWRHVCSITSQ